MKKMKTINKLFITCALFLAALAFFSCDEVIGLGSKLNLDPPTVTIIEPSFMQNINKPTLKIKGTANDVQEVVYLNISVEKAKGTAWKTEIQGERGNWKIKKNGSSSWEAFSGTWEGKSSVAWEIEIPMTDAGADEGEYIISAGAENNVQNVGPVTQQRAVIDTKPPVTSINLPVLYPNETDLSSYQPRKYADLDKLHNKSIKIQYEVKDDFSIDTLELQLVDHTGSIYYNKIIKNSWSGSITVEAKDIKDADNRQILQIISIATDKAGNEQKIDTHGWLAWDPKADIPWAEGIGDTTEKVDANLQQIYPGQTVYGQAYDNQGVKSVTYTLYSYNGSSYDNPITHELQNIPLQQGTDPSAYFPFNFNAPTKEGRYKIETVTEDIYGKKGTDTFYFYVKEPVNNGPLLVSFSGSTPGLYGIGAVINIDLLLREPVKINDDATLTLNFKSGGEKAQASLVSGNNTSQLKFTYTVVAGDNIDVLKIDSINITGQTTPEGYQLPTPNDFGYTKGLEYYTRIEISTNVPELKNVDYNNSTLTLTFNKNISKGTGNITLTQQGTLLAPAVLTKKEYNSFGGKDVLGTYYIVGINGTDKDGNPDTSEKYILDYDKSTSETTLINALKAKGAFEVVVPVVSSAVTVSGDTLTVDLSDTWGYSPRVKGIDYIITYPLGFVIDNQNNKVAALTETNNKKITNPGVNAPVIRIKKDREKPADGTANIITIPGTPTTSTYWIYNADIEINASSPGADWAKVDQFYIYIPAQTTLNLTTYGMSISNPNSKKYIQLPSGASQHQGGLYSDGNSGYMRSYSDYINGASRTAIDPYWLNPYSNTIGQGGGDSREGAIVISNAWVNTKTGSKNTTSGSTSPGTGWLRVTETVYAGGGTISVPSINTTQPTTAQVKIDCQTPDATISSYYGTTTTLAYGGKFGLSNETGHPTDPKITQPDSNNRGASFTIGDTGNISNGLVYFIKATATKGTSTATAYEKAARSVIRFNDITAANNWGTLVNKANAKGRDLHLWLRGGDGLSGSSLTPGFPLSWSDKDYKGARLMTKEVSGGKTNYYWITWEVSTQAYFHFIAGTTTSADETAKGPLDWGWGKNAWAFQYAEFPLYAGGSLVFSTATEVTHPATATFEFYDSFSGSR